MNTLKDYLNSIEGHSNLYNDLIIHGIPADELLTYEERLNILNEIMKHPYADPSGNNNIMIIYAAENGLTDLVKELMKDSRVDPSANNNEATYIAFQNNHFDVVKELIKDKRVYDKFVIELDNIEDLHV